MEEIARADAMAKSMQTKDVKGFWKSVSKSYNRTVPLTTCVNGANNPTEISDMWKNHFEKLLNCVTDESNKQRVETTLNDITSEHEHLSVTPDMVETAINKLKSGKSCGNDGLAGEHFKHADSRIYVLLSLFYTCMLTHGYIPDNFMKTVIIPLVKNKSGDMCNVNNYRPIALVTVASKILEIILLDHIQDYLLTSSNQFGF